MKISVAQTPLLQRIIFRQSYLLALALLIIALIINYILQPNFFRPAIFEGNLQTYLPLMLLAAGQAIVIIGGGVDLSVGAIVSFVNVVIVRMMGTNPSPTQILVAVALGLLCGLLAGALNGICVAYLRFQPIVTTFASSFIFSGLALWVLASPGGSVPTALTDAYAADPLGLPTVIWVVIVLLLLWNAVRATRYIRYLYSVGGQAMSAYVTGVPVSSVRLSTYILSGLFAALSAFALVLNTGTGDPLVGGSMTLSSIVAVVLGGTRLSGGQGGITGSLIGVVILSLILSIIAFANVPTWWQTLIDGFIVMIALAGPGLALLAQRRVR